MSSTTIPKVVPAQLSFLAIYNPSLGTSDETFHDQIVFYYSKAANARSKIDDKNPQAERDLREEENEKLRQVGLAQGMVGFARSFSNGEAVDSVETHKSRIVLKELEKGWWILASIDLTQLPAATNSASKTSAGSLEATRPPIEYSSREVSPPALLLQQLSRTYSIFLLHHGSNLEGLWAKLDRSKFCYLVERYWSRFASNWDVLLHGSPSVDIFDGMKLAAGGELGMGVGEEEWGSGEREVLEDYARRTDGLVDIMVSRFGEPSMLQTWKDADKLKTQEPSELEPWLGGGKSANAVDGVVFSGVGALTRQSLRDLSHWVQDIYLYGDSAYGVKDNPTADRRKRRRKNPRPIVSEGSSQETKEHKVQTKSISRTGSPLPPGIPPPIVTAAEASLEQASAAVDSHTASQKPEPFLASLGDTETWMKYMTLGYGSAWGGQKTQSSERNTPPTSGPAQPGRQQTPEISMRYVEPEPDVDRTEEKLKRQIQNENAGYFIVGLKGDMEDENIDDENEEGDWNTRIPLRTIHVKLTHQIPETPIDDETPNYVDEPGTTSYFKDASIASSNIGKFSRLRPVVYVHRPFIYTFLFHHRTESLTLAPFYRDLHTYFSPLHRPLSNSTSPDRVATRIAAASHPTTTISRESGSGPNIQPIYDLVYDPRTLTVHSSLPNIPEPGALIAQGLSSSTAVAGWSRLEALNVHSQILATVSSTRRTPSEIERTCKTGRGWWIVWMRLPPSSVDPSSESQASQAESRADPGFNAADLREAFLVRRSRDAYSASTKSSNNRLGSGMWRLGGQSTEQKMGGAAAGWGPRGLAEGIGIDARRYIEGLLSLNR